MNMQADIKELEVKLKTIKKILDPKNADLFEDIDKSIRILKHKNKNHYKTCIVCDLDDEMYSKLTDLLNQASTIAGKISRK